MIVDVISHRYRGTMRDWNGSLFQVDWAAADETAAVFLPATPFRSGRAGEYGPFDLGWIGEIPQFRPPASTAVVPDRVCTNCHVGIVPWWTTGFPTTAPLVVLDLDGWPLGCGKNNVNLGVTFGGARLGGISPAPVLSKATAQGGSIFGGHISPPSLYLGAFLGGIDLGGGVDVPAISLMLPLGGSTFGGFAISPPRTATFTATGTSSAAFIGAWTAAATFTATGTSSAAFIGAWTAAATFAMAGISTVNFVNPLIRATFSALGQGSCSGVGTNSTRQATFQANGAASCAGVGRSTITNATRVQGTTGAGAAGTLVSSVHWPVTTTAGNCLFCIISTRAATAITPPAGWLTAAFLNPGGTVGNLVIYYYPNAPAHSGGEAFVLTSSLSAWAVILKEYSGIKTSSPLDASSANSSVGGSTSPTTGATGTTTDVYEFALAAWLLAASSTPGTPTNGFTFEIGPPFASGSFIHDSVKNLSATGAISTGITTTPSTPWVGLLATFKLM